MKWTPTQEAVIQWFLNGYCISLVVQCIGATTLDEHRKHVEKDKALARRFQPVMVAEPSMVRVMIVVVMLVTVMMMG